MKYRDIMKLIQQDDWVQVAQRGSHRQFKHPVKPGRVTIAGKPNDDVPHMIRKSILRQAGLMQISNN